MKDKKIKNKEIWKITTIVLVVLLGVSIFTYGFSFSGSRGGLTAQKAADKAVSYINNYLLQPGTSASLISVEEKNNLYNLKLNIAGREYDSYVTKDGELLFTSGIELEETDIAPRVEDTTTRETTTTSKVDVSVDDDPSIGPDNAPVTIIEFSDFECPFCARVVPTVKRIIEEYGDKVRVVFRDFPLSFHANAQKAAEAAECADEQGKFWDYHDKIFENQQAIGVSDLKEYAADLGLDTTKFNDCLDSGKYEEEVKKDFQDGQAAGVSGTPAFFVNGQLVSGAQPFENFARIIDAELGGKE